MEPHAVLRADRPGTSTGLQFNDGGLVHIFPAANERATADLRHAYLIPSHIAPVVHANLFNGHHSTSSRVALFCGDEADHASGSSF